jgi:hypothetical protein
MLHRIRLNHALARQVNEPVSTWLLALGFVAAIALFTAFQYIHKRNSALEDAIYHLQAPTEVRAGPKRVVPPAMQEEISEARKVMAELSLQWETLFETLESLHIPQIKLVSIEPDSRQGRLRLTADATDLGIMLLYMERLSKRPIFKNVVLVSHENIPDVPQPVRFVVEAEWKP